MRLRLPLGRRDGDVVQDVSGGDQSGDGEQAGEQDTGRGDSRDGQDGRDVEEEGQEGEGQEGAAVEVDAFLIAVAELTDQNLLIL